LNAAYKERFDDIDLKTAGAIQRQDIERFRPDLGEIGDARAAEPLV